MQHYAGIDVSLELLSVCIVDAKGKIVKEAKVGSDPDTLVAFLLGLDLAIERIGLEVRTVIAMAACRIDQCRI